MQTLRSLWSWMFGQPHWLSDWSQDDDTDSDEHTDPVPMEWLSPRYKQPQVNQVDDILEY